MFSNMFGIRGEESVYFNITGEGSVIQESLRGGECNLLFYLIILRCSILINLHYKTYNK